MPSQDDAYLRHQQMRWLRPDAYRWVRSDAARWFAPGTKLESVFPALALKYSPNQPRVPSGNPDGGQWTDGDGGWGDTQAQAAAARRDADQQSKTPRYDDRLASNDKLPEIRRASRFALVAEVGRRLIRQFRSDNLFGDLFGHDRNTVAHTKLGDLDIFGTNSTSPMYYQEDRQAADRMRDVLIEKYPEIMNKDDIGQFPNNALYHAETNVLLRRAHESGGSLEGQLVEIYVDRNLCGSCQQIIPLVGLELGNPEIIVIDPQKSFRFIDGKLVRSPQ